MSTDNDWTTVNTSNAVKEEEKIEFEIEGEEEQPEVETQQERVAEAQAEAVEDQKPDQEEQQQSGAQKRIRQLVRQKKEREEQIAELIARQKELEDQLKNKQKEIETSVEKNFETSEASINNRIDIAKQAYRQALESGDTDRIVEAQEHLSRAQNDASMLQINKQQFTMSQQQAVQQTERSIQQEAAQYDRLAVEWAGRNPWFGQDSVMTTLALEIDNELKGEGFDPSDTDFYQEIDSRLRQRFPERFGEAPVTQRTQETSSPAQVVGGASRTSTSSSNSKKVKLSKEDIRLAEKWGIPLEQYAAEKLKVERSDGEYTSVYGN